MPQTNHSCYLYSFVSFCFLKSAESLSISCNFLFNLDEGQAKWMKGRSTKNELMGSCIKMTLSLLILCSSFFSNIHIHNYLYKLFVNFLFPSHTISLTRSRLMLHCLLFNPQCLKQCLEHSIIWYIWMNKYINFFVFYMLLCQCCLFIVSYRRVFICSIIRYQTWSLLSWDLKSG